MCVCVYIYKSECLEVGELIYADCCDWDRLNNSAKGPSKCGAPLSGTACFSAAALNQSAWLRYKWEACVREAQSAAPRGQSSSWQIRATMANQAWDRLAVLHFSLSLWDGVGMPLFELAHSSNAQVAQWNFDAQCILLFCSAVWEETKEERRTALFMTLKGTHE